MFQALSASSGNSTTRDRGVLSIGAVFEECRAELNLIVPWLSTEMLQVLCGRGTTHGCAQFPASSASGTPTVSEAYPEF